MPRGGALSQIDQSRLTPFAQIVYDYLLSQMPTMLVKDLSDETGISNNAIWSWLRHGVIPKRQTIVQLAERVPDIAPLDELLRAAGLPTTEEVQRERLAHTDPLRASLETLMALVDSDPAITPASCDDVRRFLERQLQAFIARTDTWREWNHASPAQHEAQRAADEAQVYEPEPITTPEQAHGIEPAPPRQRHRRTTGGEPSGPYRRVTGN